MSSDWVDFYDDARAGRHAHDPGIGWGEVFRAWLRASWIILPIALLGGVAAFALSLAVEPVYEAEAVIMVDRPNSGRLDNAADAPPSDAQQRAALVRSQIEILRGHDVMAEVIGRLRLAEQPAFNPVPALVSRLLTATMSILGVQVFPGRDASADSAEAGLIRAYLDHLAIRQEPDTYVLHVSFRAPDPMLAERVVNAHVASYADWLQARQVKAIKGAEEWLVTAVTAAHAHVVAAEAAVQDFNKGGVLVNVEGRTALDQGLAQLTSDLATAQAALVKAEARADEIRRLQKAGQNDGIAAMSGSKGLEDLKTAYAQSLTNSMAMQSSFGSRYPLSVQAGARSAEIKAAIAREIDHFIEGEYSQANIARATVANLTEALDKMKQQVVAAGNDRSTLTRLEGEAAAERATYLSLLQKLRSYDKVDLLAAADVVVLSPAMVPDRPRSPQRGPIVIFGFLLAGGIAAGASAWRLGRRDTVRDTSDAAGLTGVRCLGVMPELKLGRAGGIDRQQSSYGFFREELRLICAALVRDHAGERSTGISVMVTSSLPGEGKSTFCYELGLLAAQSGVRTLIVRVDLPTIEGSRCKAVVERPGLASSEDDLPLFDIEWTVPATLLSGADFGRSFSAWRREFGLIIFDTPPLSAMAESIILAPLADATIVLARVDRTPRPLLASVINQIGEAGGRIAGLVVSFARLDSQRGMIPSDFGYYFDQNRAYHRRLTTVRDAAAERT